MQGFWLGVVVGVLIIAVCWIIYLHIQVKEITNHLAETNQADANEAIEKSVSGLTNDELNALISKDFGRGTPSGPTTIKSK